RSARAKWCYKYGNTEGAPDTGGNTTVTPILNGPNKDDLAFLSTEKNTAKENTNEPLSNINTGIISESISFSTKQLDKKFKHAADFGVTTTKKNSDTIAEYQTAIRSHLDNKKTYEHGTYLLIPESKVYFNPQSNNVVVVDKSSNFVSGWKLDPQPKQYENFINNGTLR
ncbi:colicin D domain-containing protein, partial [Erwinia sp.]|uniref:colicin D domain-containing protein n=1 Tax=Erwinia citreus TaxID=558 RepID=UPI0028A0F060